MDYKPVHPTPKQVEEWKRTPEKAKPTPLTHEEARKELGWDLTQKPPEVPRY
jgi:hypothetical protein